MHTKFGSKHFKIIKHLGCKEINGRIILKWVLQEYGRMVWNRLNWLGIGSSGGSWWVRARSFGLLKSRKFLDHLWNHQLTNHRRPLNMESATYLITTWIWLGDIKVQISDVDCEDEEWIELAHDVKSRCWNLAFYYDQTVSHLIHANNVDKCDPTPWTTSAPATTLSQKWIINFK
jgi:hypothetical protein